MKKKIQRGNVQHCKEKQQAGFYNIKYSKSFKLECTIDPAYARSSSNVGDVVIKLASSLVIHDHQFMVLVTSRARCNEHSRIT